jgi:hypothetical protein
VARHFIDAAAKRGECTPVSDMERDIPSPATIATRWRSRQGPPSVLTLSDRLGSGTQSVNHAGERIANVGRPPSNLAMDPGRRR